MRNLIDLVESTSRVFYHVTPARNVKSIQKKGLVPAIGDRSSELGETEKAIYLFADLTDVEDAVMNWLGDAFDEDETLALLRVELPDGITAQKTPLEWVVRDPIPASAVTVITRDLDDL